MSSKVSFRAPISRRKRRAPPRRIAAALRADHLADTAVEESQLFQCQLHLQTDLGYGICIIQFKTAGVNFISKLHLVTSLHTLCDSNANVLLLINKERLER